MAVDAVEDFPETLPTLPQPALGIPGGEMARVEPNQNPDVDEPAVAVHKLFSSAFLIHGIKRVADNAMKSILPEMSMHLGEKVNIIMFSHFAFRASRS